MSLLLIHSESRSQENALRHLWKATPLVVRACLEAHELPYIRSTLFYAGNIEISS
jgi:hypothetical protein